MTESRFNSDDPGDSRHHSSDPPPSSLARLERLLAGILDRHGPFVVLVGAGFLVRLLLSGWNSYWYDEILSVTKYGLWQESALDVIRLLANGSIHPPLYQVTLFHWMQVFGDSETATRTLSNLYVTGATVFLYLFVLRFATRRVAFVTAVFFSIMYAPTYFALETRSYAQTVFLVCLSGYFLIRTLLVAGNSDSQVPLWRAPSIVLLTLSNVALLLTHYYNLFFWTAQAIFLLGYTLRVRSDFGGLRNLWALPVSYLAQLLLFGGIWGSILIADYRRRSATFRVDGDPEGPVSILMDNVVSPNFRSPTPVLWLMAVILSYLLFRSLARIAAATQIAPAAWRSWWTVYLMVWMIGPVLVASAAFEITGVARYSTRYFLFSVPAIAPLLAIAIYEVAEIAWNRLRLIGFSFPGRALFAFLALLSAVFWLFPGVHAAATQTKHDWRGVVSDVVQVVQSDRPRSYVIVEASNRRDALSNFYFDRLANDIRVEYTITRAEERAANYRVLGDLRDQIERHDRLIVVFLHSRTEAGFFPNALTQLGDRYHEIHRQLRFGRGYVVFDLR